ncbi:aminotransferase class I/II-fold pyridoxal phosphate-dependent enzyme [Actinophytocola sp.]|uniref:aminotransferase class I/II-fold pyridoxal phosphate-dependent enzyme n=1 Tax=Actinophytocola sp. TaxID=1872138 RepID=UPI002D7E9CD0|nr:aminotransferase class I/II-fold pyridoxal phosphate-dependent enzyme [Actinophytocola sp.]HET9141216.1 aminotransferase class I/II-fold pyridoxal phosphate-dependent enzyme [Actinophytocola sp.]
MPRILRPSAGSLPQLRFDDLYTAVYALIDDAKTDYSVVKLYKGSHGSPNPHPVVTDFAGWFFEHRRGLVGYACHTIRPRAARFVVDDLVAFDSTHRPRVPTLEVFGLLDKARRQPGESSEGYLNYVADREHCLGAYRGGSSGFDDEARAFACAHFRQLGIPSDLDDVMVFAGGAKGVFLACCAALMCQRRFDELRPTGGVILAPSGYYQSLRLIPPIFGGILHIEDDLTGDTVAAWVDDTAHLSGRVVYVPLVNNLDGRVLTRDQAHGIAAAVVSHNATHPDNPVYVIGDDVYVGSYLDDHLVPEPIGAAPGIGPWCVSVVTPSKTFTLPTGRVAFATTTNPALRRALAHYRTVFSHGRVPQVGELTSAAALCLTPPTWITEWNAWNRQQLSYFTRELQTLNRELGREIYRVELPQGGWYVPVHVARSLFGDRVQSGVDAQAVLLCYGEGDPQSGLAMLPGELFGHSDSDGWYTLRANLAVDTGTVARTVTRLRDLARAMTGGRRDRILGYALTRARRAVPHLDQTVAHRTY